MEREIPKLTLAYLSFEDIAKIIKRLLDEGLIKLSADAECKSFWFMIWRPGTGEYVRIGDSYEVDKYEATERKTEGQAP